MVQHALRHIKEGTLDKVVVSRTQWISSRSRPEQAFQKLCQMHPRALVYLMHHPQEGTWCGATPELLLRAQQHDVHTVSLAGTRSQDHSVQWTEKERLEQKVVTDHILDVLAQQGAEDVALEGPQDRSYGDLVHWRPGCLPNTKDPSMNWPWPFIPRLPFVGGPSKKPRHSSNPMKGMRERTMLDFWGGLLHWGAPIT